MSTSVPTSKDADLASIFNKEARSKAVRTQKPKKCPRITIRLTIEEHERLSNLVGKSNVSAYVRKCVFGKEVSPRKLPTRKPVADEKALAQLLGKIGDSRMANNLNQLAYHANCGSLLVDQQTEEELKIACAQIAWMRMKLIEALGSKSD